VRSAKNGGAYWKVDYKHQSRIKRGYVTTSTTVVMLGVEHLRGERPVNVTHAYNRPAFGLDIQIVLLQATARCNRQTMLGKVIYQ